MKNVAWVEARQIFKLFFIELKNRQKRP